MTKRKRRASPRTMANAYRLYVAATAEGWNVTMSEAAEAAGITMEQARAAIHILHPDWSTRFRVRTTDRNTAAPSYVGMMNAEQALRGEIPHAHDLE